MKILCYVAIILGLAYPVHAQSTKGRLSGLFNKTDNSVLLGMGLNYDYEAEGFNGRLSSAYVRRWADGENKVDIDRIELDMAYALNEGVYRKTLGIDLSTEFAIPDRDEKYSIPEFEILFKAGLEGRFFDEGRISMGLALREKTVSDSQNPNDWNKIAVGVYFDPELTGWCGPAALTSRLRLFGGIQQGIREPLLEENPNYNEAVVAPFDWTIKHYNHLSLNLRTGVNLTADANFFTSSNRINTWREGYKYDALVGGGEPDFTRYQKMNPIEVEVLIGIGVSWGH